MKKHSTEVRGAHARVEEPDASLYSRFQYSSAQGQNKQRSQKGKTKWRVIFIIAIIVLVCSLVALGAIVYQYWSQQRAYSDLEVNVSLSDNENVALSDLTVDWDSLRAINPDVVGWIYIPDTPINYPVVKGGDNEEYLHKAFDGSTGWLASAGTIFLDANNRSNLTDQNNALYGHNMNDGSMFASLASWENSDEFNKHRDIYLLTPDGNYRYKTFSVVITNGSDAIVQTNFASEEDYTNYIQDKFNRSVITQEGYIVNLSDVKQSLLLSTCEYTQNDGRAVIFAAVVETTATNDMYFSAVTDGETGLNSAELNDIAQEYREAA